MKKLKVIYELPDEYVEQAKRDAGVTTDEEITEVLNKSLATDDDIEKLKSLGINVTMEIFE